MLQLLDNAILAVSDMLYQPWFVPLLVWMIIQISVNR